MNLPDLIYSSRKKESRQISFGGLNHSESAAEGDLYDLRNLSSDSAPYLAPRARRYQVYAGNRIRTLTTLGNVLYFMQGTTLCRSSTIKQVQNGFSMDWMAKVEELTKISGLVNSMIVMGKRLILFPAMQVYDTEAEALHPIALSYNGGISVSDGMLFGETAAENRLTLQDAWESLGFHVGDGVTITLTRDGEEDVSISAVIRAVDGTSADFDEHCFAGMSGGYGGAVSREAPPLSYLLACNNRLFGCGGNTVWASALGDPFNWYVYDGISTDSWSVETEDSGEFTGCCEFLGYPYFFKADAIYKLYGSSAMEYQLTKTTAFGVKEGASNSLSAVGSTLFYLSPAGVCAYSGGYPTVILPPEQLGGYPSSTSQAAATGSKYYLRLWLTEEAGANGLSDDIGLFVYDAQRKLWHKEDGAVAPSIESGYPGTRQRNLFGIAEDGIWLIGTPAFSMSISEQGAQIFGHRESAISSFAEFGYSYHDTMNQKELHKLIVRLQVESGAKVKILASYDDGGYQILYETKSLTRQTLTIPIRPRRCDRYRLKIEGIGDYKIYAITKEYLVNQK